MSRGSNRLEVRIEARYDQFQQALAKMNADAKAYGQSIAKNLSSAGSGVADTFGKAAGDIGDELSKAGKEGASSLDKVGDSADEAKRELQEMNDRFASSADKAAAAARGLVNELDRIGDTDDDVKAVKAQLEQLESQLKQAGDASRSIDFATAIESGQRLAETMDAIAQPVRDAAEESRNLERRIKATFSNTKDQEAFLKAAKEIKAELGDLVDEDDLARSAEILGTLKVPVEDFARVAKVSKKAGRDVEDGAQDLGEALANLGSGNADIEVLNETIRTNFGISGEVLRNFGATVDSNGKVLGRTRKEQQAAQKALRAYIDTSADYSKIAERASDNQALLANEVDKFNRAVGSQVNELKEYVAGGLLTLAKALNEVPASVKVGVAGLALLAGPMAKLAALSLQVAGALRFLGVSFPAIGTGAANAAGGVGGLSGKVAELLPRLKNFATGAGGSAVVLGALAVAAYKTAEASTEYTKSVEQVDKAESALINTQARARREH
ncbi:MAG: hypothetical protein KC800_05640, partial [Candidatus Eremiobacteraeota bacterium]|nr:hypothetical protein [Candidatus Eremiobacteraeota bacterium]